MYSSTTLQALSQHKAFIILIVEERGNSAHAAPFLLISDKEKALCNHKVSGCKTAVSEVQAHDAVPIISVSVFSVCLHFRHLCAGIHFSQNIAKSLIKCQLYCLQQKLMFLH